MNIIKLILTNIPLVVVFLSILSIAFQYYHSKKQGHVITKDEWKSIISKSVMFFWVGIMYSWASIFHVFIPEFGAKSIGWDPSPFQKEVGFYDMIVGILSLFSFSTLSSKFFYGVSMVVGGFSLLAGINHVYEYLILGNKSKNNSGLILYMDLLLPVILFFTL